MSSEEQTILIAGAGIGGLTAALALQRRGFKVRVLEQAAAIADVGAGLQISANGSRILLDLGLGPALSEVVSASCGREIRLWSTGQTWTPFEISVQSMDRYGAPYWVVHRGDLHRILMEAVLAQDPDSVILGSRAAEVRQQDDRVTLILEGGAEVQGAALAAADGVHSKIRGQLAVGTSAEFTGKMAWRGLAPMAKLPASLRKMVSTNWIGVGRNVITYPVRQGELLNFVGIVGRNDWKVESWTAQGSIDECHADFPGWHEDVHAVIANLQTPFKWALLSRPPLDRWAYDRVALLGDAAHPTLPFLGQGAVMAIEDGFILSRCLAAHRGDPAKGLQRYEDLRRPRANDIVVQSAESSRHFHNPALGEANAARAFIDRNWEPQRVEARYDWLYAYDATAVAV